jgi:hypothetical protein
LNTWNQVSGFQDFGTGGFSMINLHRDSWGKIAEEIAPYLADHVFSDRLEEDFLIDWRKESKILQNDDVLFGEVLSVLLQRISQRHSLQNIECRQ